MDLRTRATNSIPIGPGWRESHLKSVGQSSATRAREPATRRQHPAAADPHLRGGLLHWSPVGRSIVYHRFDGLRLRRVDSGAETLIVSNAEIGAEAFYAAWSKDGGKLYYLARSPKGWSIRSVPATGGASALLVDFDDPTRQHTKYGFCTDGKLFYFTIGAPESDIWVADLVKP